MQRYLRTAFAVTVLAVALATVACSDEGDAAQPGGAVPLHVAIGASDAVGTGARNPAAEGWPPLLHGRLPGGTRYANLGIAGLRIDLALEQVLPVAVDLQPSVVTVWLAVNDLGAGTSLDAYRADLDTLLGTLRRETRARIYVANVPDLTLLPAFAERDQAELRVEVLRWNAAIAASAEANGAVLVDLFTGWQELRARSQRYISRDGFHPSTEGHRRIAELFLEAMRASGGA
jgi:acyl-CoA thioesterase I